MTLLRTGLTLTLLIEIVASIAHLALHESIAYFTVVATEAADLRSLDQVEPELAGNANGGVGAHVAVGHVRVTGLACLSAGV